MPAAYSRRIHKMCLVFTSNILGCIFQIKKVLFIHRNDKDTNYVMAYQNTFSFLDINSKILEDFALFHAVCFTKISSTERLCHSMPTLRSKYNI